MYVETLTGVLFWPFDLLGNIFEQFVFHLRPSPDHYYYLFFFPFAPFPSRLPRGSFCIGLRMLLESCSLRCCLHVFCRVEFPTSRSFPMRLAARGFPGHQACGGECCYSLSRSFYFRSTYVNRAAWGPFATDTRPSSAFS